MVCAACIRLWWQVCNTCLLCRFNLLREESEGFAKLLEALLRFEKASMDPSLIKALVSQSTQNVV